MTALPGTQIRPATQANVGGGISVPKAEELGKVVPKKEQYVPLELGKVKETPKGMELKLTAKEFAEQERRFKTADELAKLSDEQKVAEGYKAIQFEKPKTKIDPVKVFDNIRRSWVDRFATTERAERAIYGGKYESAEKNSLFHFVTERLASGF